MHDTARYQPAPQIVSVASLNSTLAVPGRSPCRGRHKSDRSCTAKTGKVNVLSKEAEIGIDRFSCDMYKGAEYKGSWGPCGSGNNGVSHRPYVRSRGMDNGVLQLQRA